MSAMTNAQVRGGLLIDLDVHDKLKALETLADVPTLVVVGTGDRLTPVSDARVIAAAVPGSRLLELDRAGHCAMLERPEAVNAALLDLVEKATQQVERR